MKDRPEWLTDNIIATIPSEYLKKPEVRDWSTEMTYCEGNI